MKEKQLICMKCELEIERDEDRWVHIEDWNCNKKENEGYLHLKCWKEKEKIAIQKAFDEKAKEVSPMLSKIIGKFTGKIGGTPQIT